MATGKTFTARPKRTSDGAVNARYKKNKQADAKTAAKGIKAAEKKTTEKKPAEKKLAEKNAAAKKTTAARFVKSAGGE